MGFQLLCVTPLFPQKKGRTVPPLKAHLLAEFKVGLVSKQVESELSAQIPDLTPGVTLACNKHL